MKPNKKELVNSTEHFKIKDMGSQFISRIYVIDDDPVFGRIIQKKLEENTNYDVTVFQSGEDFFEHLKEDPDIVTLDYNLPGLSGTEILQRIKTYNPEIGTIVISGQQSAEVVVEAYKIGANNYIIKNDNTLLELVNSVRNLSRNSDLKKELEQLKSRVVEREKYVEIIGESPAILQVLRLIQKVENNNILVMITGESGTGKEITAETIHYNSPRKRKSFVPVNVAAIPNDLIESELFGHEKGAFTGAIGRRIGKFEEANGGSILLDEIGEMELDMQTKLLRVLQEGKISRLGSNKEIKLDVRVIAATNKHLGTLVKEGKFREDLYYRLQGFLINLPPLRERGNDVMLLAKAFLDRFVKSNKLKGLSFSKDSIRELLNHSWPGNIRELKSVVERAALICDTEQIEASDLIFSEDIR